MPIMQPAASPFIMAQSQLAMRASLSLTQTRVRVGAVALGPKEGAVRHSQWPPALS